MSSYSVPDTFLNVLNTLTHLIPCYSVVLGVVSDSATPWAVALWAPLSVGFPRQEYWSGLPLPTPGNRPVPGIESSFPTLAGRFFTAVPLGKPFATLLDGCY